MAARADTKLAKVLLPKSQMQTEAKHQKGPDGLYPLNLLGPIGGMPMKCIAGAVPVARSKFDLLRGDQALDRPDVLQQLGMLADPTNL